MDSRFQGSSLGTLAHDNRIKEGLMVPSLARELFYGENEMSCNFLLGRIDGSMY